MRPLALAIVSIWSGRLCAIDSRLSIFVNFAFIVGTFAEACGIPTDSITWALGGWSLLRDPPRHLAMRPLALAIVPFWSGRLCTIGSRLSIFVNFAFKCGNICGGLRDSNERHRVGLKELVAAPRSPQESCDAPFSFSHCLVLEGLLLYR